MINEERKARRAGIFADYVYKTNQAPFRSDIIGRCPDGAVSLADRMGEGGRRPGEGFGFVVLQIGRA